MSDQQCFPIMFNSHQPAASHAAHTDDVIETASHFPSPFKNAQQYAAFLKLMVSYKPITAPARTVTVNVLLNGVRIVLHVEALLKRLPVALYDTAEWKALPDPKRGITKMQIQLKSGEGDEVECSPSIVAFKSNTILEDGQTWEYIC
jgi:hypothetical protein